MPQTWTRRVGALLSPAMLVALLALVVALSGSAYAAKLISSKDIKNNSVTGKDLKNNSVTGKDLKKGAVQLSDLSNSVKASLSDTWDPSSTLVPGKTITGSVYYAISANQADQQLDQAIAFPARAPQPVEATVFAPDFSDLSTGDDARCTGSYDLPTAPPGLLCAYLVGTGNVDTLHLDALEPGGDKGFVVRLTSRGPGRTSVDLSWAYTP
ncbi:MAG: hypothetical protein WBP61_12140 [Nocardioides sp.]